MIAPVPEWLPGLHSEGPGFNFQRGQSIFGFVVGFQGAVSLVCFYYFPYPIILGTL